MLKKVSIVVCLALVSPAVGLSMASPAAAVSYTKVGSKTYSAYDYNGYRATIKPSGYTIPSGYVNAGSTVTIKKGSRTIASNRTSYSAKVGTYTAYSTVRYRSRTAYRATQTEYLDIDNYDICTITSSALTETGTVQDEFGTDVPYQIITNTGDCDGYAFGDPDSGTYIESFVGTWRSVYLNCTATNDDGFGGTVITPCDSTDLELPTGAEVDFDAYDNPLNESGSDVCEDATGFSNLSYTCESSVNTATVAYRSTVTKYRYGSVKVKRFKRTVVVKKKNSAYITLSEWRGLRSGMTVSRVSSLFGNRGYIYAVNGNRTARAYRDINKDGSYYSTYYLVFRSGRLYAWDGTQWGNG